MDERQYAELMATQQLQQQMGVNAANTQQQLMFQEQEKGLAEEQLDVEKIIENISNLLQGKELQEKEGMKSWVATTDPRRKILSEWGIQRIMQAVRFHINKDILLSNYNEEQINRQMLHFTTEMNDLVLLKYERLFKESTFEECKKIIEKKLEDKEKIKYFAMELLGQTPDKEKIKKEIKEEIEGRIEYEMEKIRGSELKERIKEYGLLLWEIENMVYATYNRALGGKERDTLRKHASFTEVRSLQPEQKKTGGMFGWLKS